MRGAEDVLCVALTGTVRTWVRAGDLSFLQEELRVGGQEQDETSVYVVGEAENYFHQESHAADELGEDV